jgi:GMP synthase-like glutamine amidotransferase
MTPLQAFRFGTSAWGVQFHLEVDEQVLSAMTASGEEELRAAGVDADDLRAHAGRELPCLRDLARDVFSRWVELL